MIEVELRFIEFVGQYMSDSESHIYIPAEDFRAPFGKHRRELLKLMRKYKAWKESIIGVTHWVINPLIEVETDITTAEIINRLYPRAVIEDDDIPF